MENNEGNLDYQGTELNGYLEIYAYLVFSACLTGFKFEIQLSTIC